MSEEQETRIRILREHQGNKCFCGAKKAVNHPFCLKHYASLPTDMYPGLNKRIGQGYEQAYAEARKYLEEEANA